MGKDRDGERDHKRIQRWKPREATYYHYDNQSHITKFCIPKTRGDHMKEIPHEEKMHCSFD